MPQAAAVSNQIDHLWAKRSNEMRTNLVLLSAEADMESDDHDFLYVDITQLQVGSMELNTIRPFFIESVSQIYNLRALNATVTGGDRKVSTSQSQGDTLASTPSQRLRGDDGAPISKQSRSDTQNSQ